MAGTSTGYEAGPAPAVDNANANPNPVVVLTGLVASFAAGVLALQGLHTSSPGGRGVTAAPAVLVGVALSVACIRRLGRLAWFVAALGVPPSAYLLTLDGDLVPYRRPGLFLVAGMVATGLILAGPLLAMRTPAVVVRVAVASGFAAALAVGPLAPGGFTTRLTDRTPVALMWAAGAAFLVAGAAFLVGGPSTPAWPSSTSDGRPVPRTGPWLPIAVGVVLVGARYWLLEHHVYVAGDDLTPRIGPRAAQIWESSFALAILVTTVLVGLAYRRAGTAGARWVFATAGLAYPSVAALGLSAAGGRELTWPIVLAAVGGVGLGFALVAGADRVAPWDAVGLLVLAVLAVTADGPPYVQRPGLLSAGATGLVFGAALVRVARLRTGAGPVAAAVGRRGRAEDQVVAGLGVASWIFSGVSFGPVVEVSVPPFAQVGWLLVAVVALAVLHLTRPGSKAP